MAASPQNSYTCEPIGMFSCEGCYPQDAPRQATLAPEQTGTICLRQDLPAELICRELEGFSHLWLIYIFHHNTNWKPLVRPPRGDRKVGVFACRAPYRPNPIGMSCVKLEKIEGSSIKISQHDLLDGTPILDIKPYIDYSDCIPNTRQGWLESLGDDDLPFDITWTPEAKNQALWLIENNGPDLITIAQAQLSTRPTDATRKRLSQIGTAWELAYRTWRLTFHLGQDPRTVTITGIKSGYSPPERQDPDDRYQDKPLHRSFVETFGETKKKSNG